MIHKVVQRQSDSSSSICSNHAGLQPTHQLSPRKFIISIILSILWIVYPPFLLASIFPCLPPLTHPYPSSSVHSILEYTFFSPSYQFSRMDILSTVTLCSTKGLNIKSSSWFLWENRELLAAYLTQTAGDVTVDLGSDIGCLLAEMCGMWYCIMHFSC